MPTFWGRAQKLFLIVAVPVHFWAVSIYLLDAPNPQGAGGWGETLAIASYILLFALLETTLLFFFLFPLSYIIPKSWGDERRLGALVSLLFMVVILAIGNQLAPLMELPDMPLFNYIRINLTNTLLYRQVAYAGVSLVVTSTLIASLLLGASRRVSHLVGKFAERLEVLALLYLFLDLNAFVYVLWRNIYL